jgi:hypothetical protein
LQGDLPLGELIVAAREETLKLGHLAGELMRDVGLRIDAEIVRQVGRKVAKVEKRFLPLAHRPFELEVRVDDVRRSMQGLSGKISQRSP